MLLHFGAVDYDTTVWVNGIEVARHRGGFTPFTADLGGVAGAGEVTLVVRARDPQSAPQAARQAVRRYANHDCNYTRTTGIWQTVWLEPVPDCTCGVPASRPTWPRSAFHLELPLTANRPGSPVRAALSDAEGEVGRRRGPRRPRSRAAPAPGRAAGSGCALWSPEIRTSTTCDVELLDAAGDGGRPRGDATPACAAVAIDGKAVTAQRRSRVPAAGARPGLVPRRR